MKAGRQAFELELEAIGEAGFGEQLAGAVWIIAIADFLDAFPVTTDGGGKRAELWTAVSFEDDFHEQLAIDGVVEGLAHAYVIEGGLADVQVEGGVHALPGRLQHGQVVQGAQVGDIGGLHAGVVNFARLQAC